MSHTLKNSELSVSFSDNGAISGIFAAREFISRGVQPFTVYGGFEKPYKFEDYTHAGEPKDFGEPLAAVCTKIEAEGGCASLCYSLGSAEVLIRAELRGSELLLDFQLKNTSDAAVKLLPVFPVLGDIALGDGGRMLGMNQSGAVDKIWAYPGGAYGNAMHQSAQFGCLFEGKDCIAFRIEDAEFVGKDIRYIKPRVEVRYFPEKTLAPGEALALPRAVVSAYAGSWKRAAREYGAWVGKVFSSPKALKALDGVKCYTGIWAEKRGKPNSDNLQLGAAIDSFEELPKHFADTGADLLEYAFYCSLSAAEKRLDTTNCCGSIRRHTDGWNVVRDDLGGAEALRRGIEKVHAMGKLVSLYVEGLIVPRESELFRQRPEALEWRYTNPDGSHDGCYTYDGFEHMCCGSEGWVCHLADMCARLMRETGADGIRLDSFSFYFWPCYNEAHAHAAPFSCNGWMRELLRRVTEAVRAVRPDAIISTESATDFSTQYLNFALDQYYDVPRVPYALEDCSVFRVMFPRFRTMRIAGGPVLESLELDAGGSGKLMSEAGESLDAHWHAAAGALGKLYTEGVPADEQPFSTRRELYCRLLTLGDRAAIVGARPDLRPEALESKTVSLLPGREPAEVSVRLPFAPRRAVLEDIESGERREQAFKRTPDGLSFITESRWFTCEIM